MKGPAVLWIIPIFIVAATITSWISKQNGLIATSKVQEEMRQAAEILDRATIVRKIDEANDVLADFRAREQVAWGRLQNYFSDAMSGTRAHKLREVATGFAHLADVRERLTKGETPASVLRRRLRDARQQ